MGDLLLKDM